MEAATPNIDAERMKESAPSAAIGLMLDSSSALSVGRQFDRLFL
jgi:hypothetical protein